MDVYHKILDRIYRETGGKQSEYVDLKEVVKEEGFAPSFDDIHKQLSRAGWISDTGSGTNVKITHWGTKEAKKTASGGSDNSAEIKKRATRVKEEIKELLIMAEELAGDPTEAKLKEIDKRFAKLGNSMDELRSAM